MVKGKFVGKIIVKAEIPDDKKKDFLSYGDLKKNWENLEREIKNVLKEELFYGECFSVSIEETENEIAQE